ncbi:helix-turn-helix domain-containing protein [Labilibacter sediminis]|nr:helix-turn-helix domain-containing protein [Labilibacter sediminis]
MKPFLIDTTPQLQKGYSVKPFNAVAFALPYHMHDRYEITWIMEGHGTRIIGDNVSSFKSGDILILGPMLPHQWQSSTVNKNERAQSVSIFFNAEFPSKDFWFQNEMRAMKEVIDLSTRGLHLKGKLNKSIARKIKKLSNISGARGVLLILEMLQDISESDQYEILASEGYKCRKNLDTDRINKITNYIFENIEQKISLPILSEMVNLHPNSLAREFKRATGFSVVDYINNVRIGKATRLLTETSKTILDICYECGFQNLSHFNRYFKKVKNTTPSLYRKSRL